MAKTTDDLSSKYTLKSIEGKSGTIIYTEDLRNALIERCREIDKEKEEIIKKVLVEIENFVRDFKVGMVWPSFKNIEIMLQERRSWKQELMRFGNIKEKDLNG